MTHIQKLQCTILFLLAWALIATFGWMNAARGDSAGTARNDVPAESAENPGNGDTLVADSKNYQKVDLNSGDKSVAVPKTLTPETSFSVPASEPQISAPAESVSVPANSVPAPRLASRKAKKPRAPLASFRDVSEICVDAETGKFLAGTNPDAPCPPASVTKIMTFYLILEAVDAGKISLDDLVETSRNASAMGGTQLYLNVGEKATVRDLLYGLMLQSANDGATALAEHLCGNVENFVQKMNETAQQLGMRNTRYVTPHGLPPPRKLKNAPKDVSTARDLAILTQVFLKRFPQALDYTATKTRNFPANEKRAKPMPMLNHNKLLTYFEGCDGFKTGWTNDGASIVTTASRGNKRVIAVVLGGLVRNKKGDIDPKTSQTERNQRAAELMYRGFELLDVLQYEATPHVPASAN